jgi:hypothetical protein
VAGSPTPTKICNLLDARGSGAQGTADKVAKGLLDREEVLMELAQARPAERVR